MLKHFINAMDLYSQALQEANKSTPSQIKKVFEEVEKNHIPVPQSIMLKLSKVLVKKLENDITTDTQHN